MNISVVSVDPSASVGKIVTHDPTQYPLLERALRELNLLDSRDRLDEPQIIRLARAQLARAFLPAANRCLF